MNQSKLQYFDHIHSNPIPSWIGWPEGRPPPGQDHGVAILHPSFIDYVHRCGGPGTSLPLLLFVSGHQPFKFMYKDREMYCQLRRWRLYKAGSALFPCVVAHHRFTGFLDYGLVLVQGVEREGGSTPFDWADCTDVCAPSLQGTSPCLWV